MARSRDSPARKTFRFSQIDQHEAAAADSHDAGWVTPVAREACCGRVDRLPPCLRIATPAAAASGVLRHHHQRVPPLTEASGGESAARGRPRRKPGKKDKRGDSAASRAGEKIELQQASPVFTNSRRGERKERAADGKISRRDSALIAELLPGG